MRTSAIYLGFLSLGIINFVKGFTIHVIGDSHSYFNFTNTLSKHPETHESSYFTYARNNQDLTIPFNIHCFIGRTMFRVGRDKLKGLDVSQLNVNEGDAVVFVFGEVDTRFHICKQCKEKKRDLQEVIDSLAHAYIKTIMKNKKRFNNLTCVITSILPPSDSGSTPEAPAQGTLAERIEITKKLNHLLQKYCLFHDLVFLDIYDIFALEDGSLNMAMSDGIVHTHPGYNHLIKNKLIKMIMPV